jgi:hypothetical protein
MTQRPRTTSLTLALLLGLTGAAPGQVIHRYTFNANANDTVGTAHATLMGGATITNGQVMLNNGGGLQSGGAGQFVELPPTAFPTGAGGLTSFSIELWTNWAGPNDGGQTWSRALDFNQGLNTGGNDLSHYLFITPRAGGGVNPARFAISDDRFDAERQVNGTAPLPLNSLAHLAVTYDSATTTATLFVNGAQVGQNLTADLNPSQLSLTTFWLGRSAFNADPYYNGALDEVTMWNRAMTPAEVAASFAAGPVPVPEPTSLALAGAGVVAGAALRRYRRRAAVPAA